MSNDDTLITQLIAETYNEGLEKDQPNDVVDLRQYFEKKLNQVEFFSLDEYLMQNNLQVSVLTFTENNQCYRLIYNKSILDFPSNWSIFKEISSEDVVFVDQTLDQDFLIDIFSEVTGDVTNLALVKEEDEVKLIYLPEESSRDHVEWFRGFFQKKNQKEAA